MKKYLFFLLLTILATSCKDKPADTPSYQFEGIIVTNDIGETLGTYGTDDGDWGKDISWTAEENQVLNFPDTVDLSGTYLGDTTGQPPQNAIFYPNPLSSYARLHLRIIGRLKFKMAIVDHHFNRLFTYCNKLDEGNHSVLIDLSDSIKFPDRTVYRLYYRSSYGANSDFHKGHGDIMICRSHSQFDCIDY